MSSKSGSVSNTSKRYPREVRERAVRLVMEHGGQYKSEWAAIESVASKCGMTPQSLLNWVRQAQVDAGRRAGVSSVDRQRIRELEVEVRELKRSNEILKAASAFFAWELDPQLKK